MFLNTVTSSPLAAMVRPFCVSGLTRLLQNARCCQHEATFTLTAVNESLQLRETYVSDVPQRSETAPDLQNSSAINEFLRCVTRNAIVRKHHDLQLHAEKLYFECTFHNSDLRDSRVWPAELAIASRYCCIAAPASRNKLEPLAIVY